MKISIVVPVYNESENLQDFLESLKKTIRDFPVEVLFINDGSTDTTEKILNEFIAHNTRLDIKLLSNQINRGHLYTRHKGVTEARNDHIILFDAHQILDKDVIKNFISIFNETKEEVIMGNILWKSDSIVARINQIILKRIYGRELISSKFKDYFITKINFDKSPKGTAILFINKKLYLRSEPKLKDKNASDDTALFQKIIDERGKFLRTSKSFSYYISRDDLKDELKHISMRGPKFVDYYFRRGTRFYKYIVLLIILTLFTPFILFFIYHQLNVGYVFGIILTSILLIFLLPLIVFAKHKDEILPMLLFPMLLLSFVFGIYRGLIIKLINQNTNVKS